MLSPSTRLKPHHLKPQKTTELNTIELIELNNTAESNPTIPDTLYLPAMLYTHQEFLNPRRIEELKRMREKFEEEISLEDEENKKIMQHQIQTINKLLENVVESQSDFGD